MAAHLLKVTLIRHAAVSSVRLAGALILCCCLTAWSSGAPLEFHLFAELTDPVPDSHLLHGAKFAITYKVDTSSLTPLVLDDKSTRWPVSNTTAVIEISGTDSLNGSYPATSLAHTNWDASYNLSGSFVSFPTATYDLGDFDLYAYVRPVVLPRTFFATSAVPIDLRPFDISTPIAWQNWSLNFANAGLLTAGNISGYAVAVPEASAATLASIALAAFGFAGRTLRR